jgi:hypothetical protein
MILPNKHVSVRASMLGLGGEILKVLDGPRTVSSLWERLRANPAVGGFGRFVLGLDLLFMVGAIELKDGLIVAGKPAS